MNEHGEPCAERIFDIVWRQRQPDDWVAEVKDTQTDQSVQVSSQEELEQFLRSRLWMAMRQTVEP